MVTTLVRDDPGRAGAYSSYNRPATRSQSARPTFGEDLPTPPFGDLRSARASRPRRSRSARVSRPRRSADRKSCLVSDLVLIVSGVRLGSWFAAHNAVGLAGESPVVGIDCLPT